MPEAQHLAAARLCRRRGGRVGDGRRAVQNFGKTPGADHRTRDHNERELRHQKVKQDHRGVLGQRRDVADLHQPCACAVAAQPQDRHGHQVDDQHQRTVQPRKHAVGADGHAAVAVENAAEALCLRRFLVEGAHHAHAGDALAHREIHAVEKALLILKERRMTSTEAARISAVSPSSRSQPCGRCGRREKCRRRRPAARAGCPGAASRSSAARCSRR